MLFCCCEDLWSSFDRSASTLGGESGGVNGDVDGREGRVGLNREEQA